MSTFKKLMKLLKAKKAIIIVALVFAFISVLLSLYVNVVIGKAVDFMVSENQVNFDGITKCIVIIAVCVLISSLFNYFMKIMLSKVSFYVVKTLRDKLFNKFQTIHIKYISVRTPGDMISRLINDIEQVSDGLIMSFAQGFTGIVTIIGTLFFMFALNVKIAIIVVIATPVTLLIARFIANNTYKYFEKQTKVNGDLSSFTEESISGITVIKDFNKQDDNKKKFDNLSDDLVKHSIIALFFSSTVNPTTRLINGIIYATVGIIGSIYVMKNPDGAFTIGILSSFLAYANQFSKPFNEISSVLAEFQGALAGGARVFEMLEIEDEEIGKEISEDFKAKGMVSMNNVDFSYNEDKELIKSLNLVAKPGERVAIVGPTGCGKTTIINLLMRFYDPNAGEILMDGTPLTTIKRDAIHKNYGMVLQETWLRNSTIRDNIAMSKPDATFEEIKQAAVRSYADNFIMQLENGYDTVISGDGTKLSYGQKQLICIARLMLAPPPMLILDEATSSIDTRTEIKVQNAFAELMEGRTSFIVAHRLSTIMNCDTIVVMKNGKIVEQGKHSELLNNNGFYSELYYSQLN